MRHQLSIVVMLLVLLAACSSETQKEVTETGNKVKPEDMTEVTTGYEEVNGLKMYYEIYGSGEPLVLIHGGGSTIQSTYGRMIPLMPKGRKLIAAELQAHGRTADRDAALSFEQDADDIAALLQKLNIPKADVVGFSNGGTTTLQLAIRHPEVVNKIVLIAALAKRDGIPAQFWEFMKNARIDDMPEGLKKAQLEVEPDSSKLLNMHDKDADRMVHFKDIPDDIIKSIQAPTFIINGDKDVITNEHALELHKMIGNSELAIIPGGHGEYLGEITYPEPDTEKIKCVISLIESFLDEK